MLILIVCHPWPEHKAVKAIAYELKDHALSITLAGACITMSKPKPTNPNSGVQEPSREASTAIFQDYLKTLKAFIITNPHDQKGRENFVIHYSYKKLTAPAAMFLGILAEFGPAASKGIPSELFERCEARAVPPVWLHDHGESNAPSRSEPNYIYIISLELRQ